MAQWSIKRTCGHTTVVQLYGKSSERERRADWLATQPCSACARKAAVSEAQDHAEALSLPALQGTEKQVAWALQIREKGFDSVDSTMREFERQATGAGIPPEKLEAERAQFRVWREQLVAQTAASWWIDHRGDTGRHLLIAVANLSGATA